MALSLPLSDDEEPPCKDLTNQVVKTECHYFAGGGFSEIYKGDWRDSLTGNHRPVAIKIFRGVDTNRHFLENTIRRLNRETRVWHSLCHENVLPFLGLCRDLGPSPAMISPLCHNGDVSQYLLSNPRADRQAIIIGVAHGLEYFHSRNVIHGDLKGHNVMIDDNGIPLLADFGQSEFVDHRGFTDTVAGSARYLAPELVGYQPDADDSDDASEEDVKHPPYLTKETDVFAFSMVALEILTGKLPYFYLRLETTVIASVYDGVRPDRQRCLPTTFTDPMWAILVDCWFQDPHQRPDMALVTQRLARPGIVSIPDQVPEPLFFTIDLFRLRDLVGPIPEHVESLG